MSIEFVPSKRTKKNQSTQMQTPTLLSSSSTPRIDPANRQPRSGCCIIADTSDSVKDFVDLQFQKFEGTIESFKTSEMTMRSVVINIVQIGTPPVSTGFVEIQQFKLPKVERSPTTPMHLAIDRCEIEFGQFFADLRPLGIDRTQSIALIISDGDFNGADEGTLTSTIQRFHQFANRYSVTPVIFAVGEKLNETNLKRLALNVPPLKIDEFNADYFIPFIQKLVVTMTQSQRDKMTRIELPEQIKILG